MSEKPKFTPGPWKTDEDDYIWAKRGIGEVGICRICDLTVKSEVKPNARLIVKAPEMYQNMVDNLTTIDLANSTAATICANNCCWGNCSSCPVSEIIRLLGVMKEQTEKLKKEVDGEV